MTKSTPTPEAKENFALDALHPRMVGPIAALIETCRTHVFAVPSEGGKKFVFHAFEGFRHPLRQYDLFARGKVTKARPWQSAHQYGLAVDFACFLIVADSAIEPNSAKWPDDAPWKWLATQARRVGLTVPIEWDKGHVQHPLWITLRKHVL